MVVKIVRTAEEINAQIDLLRPMTDNSFETDAAYEALRWVIGDNDDAPAESWS